MVMMRLFCMTLSGAAAAAVFAGEVVYDARASRETVATLVKEMAKRTAGDNMAYVRDVAYYPE